MLTEPWPRKCTCLGVNDKQKERHFWKFLFGVNNCNDVVKEDHAGYLLQPRLINLMSGIFRYVFMVKFKALKTTAPLTMPMTFWLSFLFNASPDKEVKFYRI